MEAARVVSLLPCVHELTVERLVAEPGCLIVIATARRSEARCPSCGVPSRRVHSRYERDLADLLPDREPGTLAAWPEQYPTIEFISRDRAGGYAEGATKGAPQAIQVADRFHLLKNLTEAVQRSLERHQRTIRSSVPGPSSSYSRRRRPAAS